MHTTTKLNIYNQPIWENTKIEFTLISMSPRGELGKPIFLTSDGVGFGVVKKVHSCYGLHDCHNVYEVVKEGTNFVIGYVPPKAVCKIL